MNKLEKIRNHFLSNGKDALSEEEYTELHNFRMSYRGTPQDTQHARDLFQEYFESFNHAPDLRLIFVDNRIVDLDYLLGLTYYYENSAECIPLFEASLKNKDFNRLQRGDLLRKMSSCYRDALCGINQGTNKANDLSRQSLKYSGTEICEENIEI